MGDGQTADAAILDRLFDVIRARREERPEGSYVVSLLDGGWDRIAEKVVEEAAEFVGAGRDDTDEALAHEAADLVFHLLVGLAARGVTPESVYAELARRFGIGGLEEKAARGQREREADAR